MARQGCVVRILPCPPYADQNIPLQRTSSNAFGTYRFQADSGNYYVGVTAMGRIPAPAPGARYTPFRLDLLANYTRNFHLRKDSFGVDVGGLVGKIEIDGLANLAGVLVIATGLDSSSYSATSGPDGVYIFHNLPVGDGYTLVAWHSGPAGDTVATQANVALGQITRNVVIKLTEDPGRALKGQVQFLAISGATTDITLVDPDNRLAIPGLCTFNAGGSYRMEHIPMGTYIVWGSYLNDGYVMDPDHIRKFGLPKVTKLAGDTAKKYSIPRTSASGTVGIPPEPSGNGKSWPIPEDWTASDSTSKARPRLLLSGRTPIPGKYTRTGFAPPESRSSSPPPRICAACSWPAQTGFPRTIRT